ncbi:EcsC family protein, partial [Anaerosolibacter sp.]|uniref:EcsC family protein n=1 Tax=Anaerosolibacter sp. TaxID=1872527 RepID=UPI0039EE4BD6
DLKALEKLDKWELDYVNKSENNIFKNAMEKTGQALKPITNPVAKKIKPITDSKVISRIQNAIQVAMVGVFQFTHDNIKYTYTKDYILKALKIESSQRLYEFNADEIERHVRKVANQSKIASTLEGFGLGMGGLESTLIEIPIFFSLIARVQQQICACYGYDPENEFEQSYMLKALSFSDVIAVGGKSELLLELNALKVAIKRHTYKQLNEMGGKYAIPQIAKNFAKQQGKNISKKKMTQAIPIVGGVIGGLFNYGYINRVINVTNNLYKKRFLEEKKTMYSKRVDLSNDVVFEET